MSSEEEKKETGLLWEKYRLHFTVIYSQDTRWPELAAEFRCWDDQNAEFAILVAHPYFTPAELNYIAETVDLIRPKADWQQEGDEDRWETLRLRTRIFRFERTPTKSIVPPLSAVKPAQPYAEILWVGEAVSTIEIKGLENLTPRGGGVADEARRLAAAVDTLLGLSHDSWKFWIDAKKAKPEAKDDVTLAPLLSPEEKWLVQACPGAKAIGLRGEALTRAALAQELKVSEGTITNRKRENPTSWVKIEAAHADGIRQRLTDQT